MTLKKGYYLYALFNEKKHQDFGPIGIGEQGDRVYTLHYKGLAMAVSRAPVKNYDPTRKNIMAHQKVVSTILQRYDILPISFGTCVGTYKEVQDIFKKLYDQALSTLDRIKNRMELGLKVFWKKEAFAREIASSGTDVNSLKNSVMGGGEKAYMQVLELGEKLMNIANDKRRRYAELLLDPLRNIAVDTILMDITNERMVINATFLVDKEKEEEFDRAVNDIYSLHEHNLEFKYTGPWPPYSFVDIRIPREE